MLCRLAREAYTTSSMLPKQQPVPELLFRRLENLALQQLDTPEGQQSEIAHRIEIAPDLILNVVEETKDAQASYTKEEEQSLEFFLNRGKKLVFSSIIDDLHIAETPFAHGRISDEAWIDEVISLDIHHAHYTFLDTFATLGREAYTQRTNGAHYDLPLHEQLATPLISRSRQLLAAHGLFSAHRFKTIDDGAIQLSLEANEGESLRFTGDVPALPLLSIAVTYKDVTYFLQKRADGEFEQKIYHGPEPGWQRDLVSYYGIPDENGVIIDWGFSLVELAAKEQSERELGMYMPTIDIVKDAIKKLGKVSGQ